MWLAVTKAGYGGFVFEQHTKHVFYFHGEWDAAAVEEAGLDINDMEAMGSAYSADICDQVLVKLGMQHEEHYLYSIGDSAVFFAHVAENGRATSPGLRYIYRQRVEQERSRPLRTNCFLHLTREWNAPSDRLADGDVDGFARELRWLLGTDATFERLHPADTRIDDLCRFVQSCRPPRPLDPDRVRRGKRAAPGAGRGAKRRRTSTGGSTDRSRGRGSGNAR